MKNKYRVFMDHDGIAHLIRTDQEEAYVVGNPGFLKRWLTDWVDFDYENPSQ